MRVSEVIHDIGRPIAYYPRLAKVCGGVSASVLLCQFIYWSDKGRADDGWVYKTQAELEEETGLTAREQRHARDQLGPMLEARYDRLQHRQFYRVNMAEVDQACERTWSPNVTSPSDESALPEVPNAELPNASFGNSETGSSYKNQRLPSEKELEALDLSPTAGEQTKPAIATSKTPKAKPAPKPKAPPHPETSALVAYFAELADTPTLKASTPRVGQEIKKALGAGSAVGHIREAIERVVREGAPGRFGPLLNGVERHHRNNDPAPRDTPIARLVLGLGGDDSKRHDDDRTIGEVAEADYGYTGEQA